MPERTATGLRRARARRAALCLSALLIAGLSACAAEVDVEKLFVQSNSDDYEERVEARQRLAELIESGSVEPFAKGLQSPNVETRVQSILHLLAIHTPESKKPLVGELELSRRFNTFYNPIRLVPVSTPSDSRIMVAHILESKGGDPKAVEILADSYGKEPDTATRVATVYALGALQDKAAVPALHKALRDPEMDVVRAALEGLTQIRTPGIAGMLIEGLADQNETIRANSATALSSFGEPDAAKALLDALHKDPSPKVRLSAVGALPNAAGYAAFNPILSLLKDPHAPPEMKDQAATSLQSLTGQDFGQDAARWAKWWEQNKTTLAR
ncbi:MAG TPA: HEAT repeat domain-containing protein [Candidatus Polarisedimenticolia bacterium]|nr:HEAT repeat domain-containing protein [Candidatus Polarisedimenticolia bacterium]